MQVAGYSYTRIHLTYAALYEVTWYMVVTFAQNVRRDGSSFMWHQPYNNQIALSVHPDFCG